MSMTTNEWVLCIGVFFALWFISTIGYQLIKLFFLWLKFKFKKY